MTAINVELRLDRESYRPGEELIGVFQVDGEVPEEYRIELSVLWHTEGKGTEDLGVILFQEWSSGKQHLDFGQPQPFSVRMPRTPLTYDGQLVKILWIARVRVRWLPNGEMLSETPFLLESPRGD